jgi:hypothetical protein
MLVGMAAMALWSCGSAESSTKTGSAAQRPEARRQVFEFGKARQSAIVQHTFQVVNTLDVPVKVTRVQTTCGCTVATVKKNTVVEPGKTLDVPVNLNVRGKSNPIESKVIVNYADGVKPDELILKGTAAEEYPNLVDFAKFKRGEQPEQIVTLTTFEGQAPLVVQDIAYDKTKLSISSKPGAKEGTVDLVLKPAAEVPFG